MVVLISAMLVQAASAAPATTPAPAPPSHTELQCGVIDADGNGHALDISIRPHRSAGNLWTVRSDLWGFPSVTDQRDVRRTGEYENLPDYVPYAQGTPYRYVNVLRGERGAAYTIEIASAHTEYPDQDIVASVQVSVAARPVVAGIVEPEETYVAAGLCRPRRESGSAL